MLHITYVAVDRNNVAEFRSMKYTTTNESMSKARPTKNVIIYNIYTL